MKSLIKTFMLRGLVGMGFGPLVMAIIYLCLYHAGVVETIAVPDVVKAIFSITHDHRVIDGYPAALFLQSLTGYIENPVSLLLD